MSATIPGTLGETSLSKGPFRAARGTTDFLQGMAAGSGAADVDEQSGPGGGGESAGIGGLRREPGRRRGTGNAFTRSCDP